MTTEAFGLAMKWNLCRNHFGGWVIHGFVGMQQRMEHGFGRNKPSLNRCVECVTNRLREISREGL